MLKLLSEEGRPKGSTVSTCRAAGEYTTAMVKAVTTVMIDAALDGLEGTGAAARGGGTWDVNVELDRSSAIVQPLNRWMARSLNCSIDGSVDQSFDLDRFALVDPAKEIVDRDARITTTPYWSVPKM